MNATARIMAAAGMLVGLLSACAAPSPYAASGASGSQGSGTASGAATEAEHRQSAWPGVGNTDAGPTAEPNEGRNRGDRR